MARRAKPTASTDPVGAPPEAHPTTAAEGQSFTTDESVPMPPPNPVHEEPKACPGCAAKQAEIERLQGEVMRIGALVPPPEPELPFDWKIIEPARSTITVICRKCCWENAGSFPFPFARTKEDEKRARDKAQGIFGKHPCGL